MHAVGQCVGCQQTSNVRIQDFDEAGFPSTSKSSACVTVVTLIGSIPPMASPERHFPNGTSRSRCAPASPRVPSASCISSILFNTSYSTSLSIVFLFDYQKDYSRPLQLSIHTKVFTSPEWPRPGQRLYSTEMEGGREAKACT